MRLRHHIGSLCGILMISCLQTYAQPSLSMRDYDSPSGTAPGFFGPNAFPVPDMMSGETSADFKLEIYADHTFGTKSRWSEDYTLNPYIKFTAPLFSPRVNLVIWGYPYEYFSTSQKVAQYRKVGEKGLKKGGTSGDLYVSTDFMLLTQEKHKVDLSVRTALKSASGEQYLSARYYDTPGYFFDLTAGRDVAFRNGKGKIRFAASAGFLCWQIENARQNDAIMYGAMTSLTSGAFSIDLEYGGYIGWEKYGDCPMTIKVRTAWEIGNFSIGAAYHAGLKDWPFNRFRIGLAYRFPVWNSL